MVDRPQSERRGLLDGLGIERPPWMTSPLLDLPRRPAALLGAGREMGSGGLRHQARRRAATCPAGAARRGPRSRCCGAGSSSSAGGSRGAPAEVGSLALGVWEARRRRLRYVGLVGSGLAQTGTGAFSGRARRAERGPTARSPARRRQGCTFMEPVLVAEVRFSEVTDAGTLRHPVLVGFRTDIDRARRSCDDDELT